MTIEEFWNEAYLACLTRLSAKEAKTEADKALDICINHWNSKCYEWASVPQLWQQQHVAYVNLPKDISPDKQIYRKPNPDRSRVKVKTQ